MLSRFQQGQRAGRSAAGDGDGDGDVAPTAATDSSEPAVPDGEA
jgi:hypothetical protein